MLKEGDTVRVLRGSLEGQKVVLTQSSINPDILIVEGLDGDLDYICYGVTPLGSRANDLNVKIVEKIDPLKEKWDKVSPEAKSILKGLAGWPTPILMVLSTLGFEGLERVEIRDRFL